ncbi:riboflavin synthase [Bacillus ginsengihumi]|uniref:Riboflavin synthase n=1 Tax=Heyndrickxia ginsengihumi TaxID=363870 RepID=A0A6M0P250_9BACI|nr:riboflavin synthase [Heyndrickxia ginsengihumi]NEY18601.1 riboflavin synthase [Heyndrickxia ginsengihumi]
MFTGIIEEIGVLKRIRRGSSSLQLVIQATKVLKDVHVGDSIAVNGVCLTVTSYTVNEFTVDVMPETFYDTTLASLSTNSKVNLERAMSANGRFGGHFVTGHVDGVGTIVAKKRVENALYVSIDVPKHLIPYLITKGSIAIDGTSLTIFDVKENSLTISLIPHTQDESIIASKGIGEKVNIESDVLAKYVGKMIHLSTESNNDPSTHTMDLLRKSGFIS